jgi:anti-sigma factor RsiW
MKSPTVSHKIMFRHLCENLDQRLDSPECRAIRKHLADCPECLTFLGTLKSTVALFRRYAAPPMSAASRKKLYAAVRAAKAVPARKRRL